MNNKAKTLIIVLIALMSVYGLAYAVSSVTATIDSSPPAAGIFTDSISPSHKSASGQLLIDIYGSSWSATVWLQHSFDSGTTWRDVESYTSNTSNKKIVDFHSGILYRIGVKSGGFSSGSVAVGLYK